MSEEIKITFEALFSLLRREMSRDDIQELEQDFYESVKDYLSEKRSMLLKQGDQQMLFSEEEQKKTLHQITNIKKILRELYDRREKKIINLAVNMSKTNSREVDTSKLLADERKMYDQLIEILNTQRKLFYSTLGENGVQPRVEPPPKEEPKSQPETINVKFLEAVPKFIDPALKVHGPFEPEDTSELPITIANVLIKKGKVEVI